MFTVLRKTCAVTEPDDPGYDTVRKPVMERFHHVRPRAIVHCASAADVASALDVARQHGLPLVPRGGGHCFAGSSSTTGIVLDMSGLDTITVSGDEAVIGAGARLAEVYATLHRHGRTLPAGCGATVGITGLTLGGGLGLLGRTYGLTCDRLRGATVVLADGRVVETDEHREPDLFWALRGGGRLGVVTELRFATVPSPAATAFVWTWPFAAAADLIAAWQEYAPDAPPEISANLKVSRAGVTMFGAYTGEPPHTVLKPDTDVRTALPYPDLKRALELPGEPGTSKSEFFRAPLPADVVTELLTTLDGELNFTPMGGAYNAPAPADTAFTHRRERFLLEHVGARPDRSWAITHPHGSGGVYQNFPDPDLADEQTAYYGDNLARLRSVRQHYAPAGSGIR